MTDSVYSRRRSWSLVGLFLAGWVVLSLFGGWVYYLGQKESFTQRTSEQLGSVADLKVAQIVAWNRETKADMEVMFRSATMGTLQESLAHPDDENLRRELQQWMESQRRYQGYRRMALIGNPGRVLIAVPNDGLNPPVWTPEYFAPLLQATDIVFHDLHKHGERDSVHLNYWVPIGIHPGRMADGVLLVELDPQVYLYPLIEQWPVSSRTAETLLVRKEGESIVFLNNLRHKPRSALDFRIPLKGQLDETAARAVSGYVGTVEGHDYRGAPVLAAVRPVPGSPWFMISKMDKEELFAPLRQRAWFVAFGTAIVILTIGLAFRLMLRTRETGFLKKQLAAERERQMLAERVIYLSKHANDIIVLADENWHIVDSNNRGLEAYGYSLEEIRKISLLELCVPGNDLALEQAMAALQKDKGVVYETVHQRKSGEAFPVEVSVRMLTMNDARYYQGIIRDITERKSVEAALKQSEERFRRAIDEAPIPMMIHCEDGQVIAVNKAWIHISGYSAEEIPTIDAWTLKAHPEDYTRIRGYIRLDYTEQRGRVPAEVAIITKTGERRTWRFSAAALGTLPDGRRAAITTAEDVTEKNAAVDAMRASLGEKEALLKEVHHRVKNNLQIVSSLLNLQSAQVHDAAVLDTLRETQNRVRSMSLLHEALYRSPSLAKVNFATYVDSLCSQLYRSFGTDSRRIELARNVEGVELGLDQAIPCGLIINELVSNALKYAFADGRNGKIVVSLQRDATGMAQLRVSDNGVGLPKGLDAQTCTSLGLQLVFSLATQVKGTVQIRRDAGTEFLVTFHLPSEVSHN